LSPRPPSESRAAAGASGAPHHFRLLPSVFGSERLTGALLSIENADAAARPAHATIRKTENAED